jgi:hypothetical protein
MTTLMIEEPAVSQPVMDQTVEFGEALQEAVYHVADKFGLYDIMLHHGPITPACLATHAGIPERLARHNATPRTNHPGVPGNPCRNTRAARSTVAKRSGRR